jgi:hypothetical protein
MIAARTAHLEDLIAVDGALSEDRRQAAGLAI